MQIYFFYMYTEKPIARQWGTRNNCWKQEERLREYFENIKKLFLRNFEAT